jgi:hypothetical protein
MCFCLEISRLDNKVIFYETRQITAIYEVILYSTWGEVNKHSPYLVLEATYKGKCVYFVITFTQ